MACKTFISYKYSEAKDLRDDIIKSLGPDAQFYKGEYSESPDLSDETTERIKKKLSDMLHGTSVTIVVISPHMKESKWIPWEIKYCLKEITRDDKTSHRNGLVGVVQKVDGSYDWFISSQYNEHCHGYVLNFARDLLPEIVSQNIWNSNPPRTHCKSCRIFDWDVGSYMSVITEDEFLRDPSFYIERAFDKANNHIDEYDIPDLIHSDPQSV